jgi:hypothetical protein
MGWADCGTDSEGRPIGYAFPATCDAPGCNAKIDRGLGYACGGMHGEDEWSCEKYFCEKHLVVAEATDGELAALCIPCFEFAEQNGLLADD